MNHKVSLKEKIAFALGDVGCNFIWTVVGSFLTLYYTDSVGISAAVVGTIMLITRILDGVSDLGMGVIYTMGKGPAMGSHYSTAHGYWTYPDFFSSQLAFRKWENRLRCGHLHPACSNYLYCM